METTNGLLDQIKERHGLPSDYKLGMVLGLSKNAVGQYRKGVSRPDDAVAVRIANLLEMEPAYVVACMHAERAKDSDLKTLWISVASRFQSAGAALGCAVFALALMGSQPAESSMLIDDSSHGQLFPTQVDTGNISANVAFLLGLVLLAAVANFKRVFCLISDNSPVL